MRAETVGYNVCIFLRKTSFLSLPPKRNNLGHAIDTYTCICVCVCGGYLSIS